mmetsp:Transcript_6595/g.14622  ORF Transcript_6595/g.14622 Transcript_6595/m.14622 type:complete len:538 (+) Transcript_6595:1667-3280(+)
MVKFAAGGKLGHYDGGWFDMAKPETLNFKWSDVGSKPQENRFWRLWLGDVDAGISVKLKGAESDWNSPQGGKTPPPSWANEGHGGVNVTTNNNAVVYKAYTGKLDLSKPQNFNISIVVTPVKDVHTQEARGLHFNKMRIYHVPYGTWESPNLEKIKHDIGANMINIHQGCGLNRYINYPFHPEFMPELAAYVSQARKLGMTVKLYYTMEQMSNHAIDLAAFAQLQGRILLVNVTDGPSQDRSGGHLAANAWVTEHLANSRYAADWWTDVAQIKQEDMGLVLSSTSVYNNYYIEAQRALYQTVGIAGLYLDSFLGERAILKRAKRLGDVIYDMHGGAADSLDVLPFVSRMWTAEGIDWSRGPDYWLIVIASLPFGTYGEMLTSGNQWKGLVFGMTNRCGWSGEDPNGNKDIFRLWDNFGISSAHMYGWWNKSTPVTIISASDTNDVVCTAFVRPGKSTLVFIASWVDNAEDIKININNWDILKLDPKLTQVRAPAFGNINPFGGKAVIKDTQAQWSVPKLQGLALILEHKPNYMSNPA